MAPLANVVYISHSEKVNISSPQDHCHEDSTNIHYAFEASKFIHQMTVWASHSLEYRDSNGKKLLLATLRGNLLVPDNSTVLSLIEQQADLSVGDGIHRVFEANALPEIARGAN